MVVRGWNTDEETNLIIESLNIPNKKFSKTMNGILKEWHNEKKQKELNSKKVKPEVKIIA